MDRFPLNENTRAAGSREPFCLPLGLLAVLLWAGVFSPISLCGQALQWEQHPGYRVAQVSVANPLGQGFVLMSPSTTGIYFTNHLSYDRAQKNQNLLNGAGVAAGDFDGDGLCDLFFCNLEGPSALFRNLGNWKFEDVASQAGAACTNQTSRAAVFADVDGDSRLDLVVVSVGGPNSLLLNQGSGRFKDVAETAGLAFKAGCHSLAFADIDGDSDLDLYVANYGENSILRSGGTVSIRTVNGKPVVTGRYANRVRIINGQLVEFGEPHKLFLNDGKGSFQQASWTDGTFLDENGVSLRMPAYDLGLSVMFRDMDNDGDPDIYVCNDFQSPDRIWLNDGKGRFRALPEKSVRTTSHFSMGVDFADIDRDGLDDFFVTDMLSRFHKLLMTQISPTNPPPIVVGETLDRHQARRNTLQLNRGDQTWADIAHYAGIAASDWSWSAVFLDVDLDGYEDLLIATGHGYDTQDLDVVDKPSKGGMRAMTSQQGHDLLEFPPLNVPNVAFRNRGDRTFEEVGGRWGFNSTNVSHGISLADLDNDADLDVVVSCLSKPPLVYRNESSAPRVAVRLRGKSPNIQGIGAKIKVTGGAVPVQTQEIISGGRYLAGDEPMRVFAAGTGNAKLTIEVTWRSGLRSIIPNALANRIYEVDETGAQPPSATPPKTVAAALFAELTSVSATHMEETFNDFERQELLPRMLSKLGPGLGWADMDSDGLEDLLMGTGRGGACAFLRNDGKGNFALTPFAASTVEDDLTGLATWVPAPGQRAVLFGLANYESTEGKASSLVTAVNAKFEQMKNVGLPASVGPIAVADVNGDGALDVFLGGRVVPGKYPQTPASKVFLNRNGQLVPDEFNNKALEKAGLVSGAVWSDLNEDGLPDLVMACDWGPVRIFLNHQGKLVEATAELGVAEWVGWWNGVTTADVNGDGKLDIIASNWGLNSSYGRPSAKQPIQLFYGDVDGNGTLDLLESHQERESSRIVPKRNLLVTSAAIPLVRERFPTHQSYSMANVSAILGPQHAQFPHVHATTLASTVFLNRGTRFEPAPLPPEAQFAPAFAVNVADFDGDGFEDIFLSQNFFALFGYEPRLDGGRGLVLRGQGNGTFQPVPGQESGISLYGEQRGAAVCDYDGDGRTDLAVGQNSGPVRLFHNTTGKPGLRVRLKGSPGNPEGIGAVLRLQFASKMGPAREIHAGSGYWSQDSTVQVLATPEQPQQIVVRWPGGKITTQGVPAGTKEITVTQ